MIKNINFFRIDNYINYCENAQRDGLYPVSIEMLLKDSKLIEDEIKCISIDELNSLGILQKDTKIIFSKTEILDYGFPLLSKNNIEIADLIREEIKNMNLKNFTLLGVLANKDLFFESDIKKDLYNKIKENINVN